MYQMTDEEKEYLKKYDPNKYPKPCVTVDNIIFCKKDFYSKDITCVLLVKRGNYPYRGYWALPGGFLDVGKENTEQAALRELKEETSLSLLKTKLFGVYSDPNRDPRDHVVSVVYATEVEDTNLSIKAADDAAEAKFFMIDTDGNAYDIYTKEKVDLAFDHQTILKDFIDKEK